MKKSVTRMITVKKQWHGLLKTGVVLAMLAMGYEHIWALGGSATLNVYKNTGGAGVYVSQTTTNTPSYQNSMSSTYSYSYSAKNVDFYCYANPSSGNVFSHWTYYAGPKTEGWETPSISCANIYANPAKFTCRSGSKLKGSQDFNYYVTAQFRAPRVTDVTSTIVFSTEDGTVIEKDVTFTITGGDPQNYGSGGATFTNEFTLTSSFNTENGTFAVISGPTITVVDNTTLSNMKHNVTYRVRYTPTSVGKTTGSMTLTSKLATSSKITKNVEGVWMPAKVNNVVLTNVGHKRIDVAWQAVSGASYYRVLRNAKGKSSQTVVNAHATATSVSDESYDVLEAADNTSNFKFEYVVEAYNTDNHLMAQSDAAEIRCNVITAAMAPNFKIYFPRYATYATSMSNATFTTKTIQDISYLYDAGGNVLFDKICFVVDNANSANARYFEYTGNGNTYTLTSCINPKTTYPDRITVMGKKYYYTGTCEGAYAGYPGEVDRDGFIEIKGTGTKNNGVKESIDIYIEDFRIKTLSKAKTQATVCVTNEVWIRGNACVFAIKSYSTSESNTLTTNFHAIGNNMLYGNAGSTYNYGIFDLGLKVVNFGDHGTTSAAIAVKPNSDANSTAILNFYDTWVDGTPKNGYINFRAGANTPGIDQGNSKTVVNFYGGQYELPATYIQSPGATYAGIDGLGSYKNSLAISYRHYYAAEDYGALAEHYGFGTDRADGIVRIFGGTFYSNGGQSYAMNGTTKQSGEWGTEAGIYYAPNDIRLPKGRSGNYQSYIDGGSFGNGAHVYFCEDNTSMGAMPINSKGESLCRVEVSAANLQIDAETHLATIDLATLPVVDPADKSVIHTYDFSNTDYGVNSITPDKQNEIYFYLNGHRENEGQVVDIECTKVDDSEAEYWHVVLPEVAPEGNSRSPLKQGKNINVLKLDNKKNNYFAYFELDDYVMANFQFGEIGEEGQSYNFEYVNPTDPTSEVLNEESYRFEYQTYIILPLKSNEWMTLTPPFDITNVYVVEHVINGYEEGSDEYLNAQGAANAQMALSVIGDMAPNGYTSSNTKPLNITLMQSLANHSHRARNNYRVEPLIAYDGTNGANAHYYLFEGQTNGIWEKTDAGYAPNWQTVTKIENVMRQEYSEGVAKPKEVSILMQGPTWDDTKKMYIPHAYSLFFPSAISQKFWDGKYIIFEGFGPQEIPGSAELEWMPAASEGDIPEDGTVQLAGNFTFAKMKSKYLTSDMYVLDTRKNSTTYNKFIPRSGSGVTQVLPMRAYLAVGHDAAAKARAISHDGDVVWESSIVEGVPTIMNADIVVSSSDNKMYINTSADKYVTVFTTLGQLVWAGDVPQGVTQELDVTSGLYIVNANGNTKKVIVK